MMEESKLYMARVQVIQAMEQGLLWHEAASRAGLQISQSTAYRLALDHFGGLQVACRS